MYRYITQGVRHLQRQLWFALWTFWPLKNEYCLLSSLQATDERYLVNTILLNSSLMAVHSIGAVS